MKLSPQLRRVLEVGSADAIAWIEKSKYPAYTRSSLENAVDILITCLNVYDAEKNHRQLTKKQVHQKGKTSTWSPSGMKKRPVTLH